MLRVLLAAMLAVVGCGGGSSADDVVEKLRSFKDKMCRCTHTVCTDAVDAEMRNWARARGEKLESAKTVATKAQLDTVERLDDELDRCRAKAWTPAEAEAPSP